jgi:periplasmic protein TonB
MTAPHVSQARKADAWTELIFSNRNKEYGAYALRRDYNRRMQQSLAIAAGGMLMLFLALYQLVPHTAAKIDEPLYDDTNVIDKRYDIEKPKLQNTAPQPKASPNAPYRIDDRDTLNNDVDTTTTVINPKGSSNGKGIDTTGRAIPAGGGMRIDTTVIEPRKVEIMAEKMPEFPGGVDALMHYLGKHIDCPLWRESGESGNLVLSLVVNKDGSVSDVKVLRDDVGFNCADQARHVIETMPRWSPGMNGNRPVNVQYVLPVRYEKR